MSSTNNLGPPIVAFGAPRGGVKHSPGKMNSYTKYLLTILKKWNFDIKNDLVKKVRSHLSLGKYV